MNVSKLGQTITLISNIFHNQPMKHQKEAHKKPRKEKKSFFSDAKEYLIKQEKLIVQDKKRQLFFFVIGFLLFYLTFTFVAYLVPDYFYESATGLSLKSLLEVQGLSPSITSVDSGDFALALEGKTIIISWLCAGVLELIILSCAILASFGVSWRKKFIGIAIAIPLGFLFNLARVWITTNIILTQEVAVIELAHDLLFKIMLFVYITIFYVLWFYWSTNEDKMAL